jgi:ATP-binding protein involved in chromosome partitioning
LKAHLAEQAGFADLQFTIEHNVPIYASKVEHLSNVKNIIAISSGKGGVGKSATAVNLALGLKAQGARVGILDADIYGPSVPLMLGTAGESPQSPDNKHMFPINALGLASNSIGYLVKNDHASIWRGPMASKALSQLAKETRWPLLDYLIVDMPPGTGDIQLTMAQQLPLTASVIVTTPQDIALSDAEKGIAMYNKLELPVLGMVENMSYFECPECHHQTPIFSSHGAHRLSEKYALPMLAEVPLNTVIREYADSGKSLIDEQPEHAISKIYKQAALRLSMQISTQLSVSETAQALANKIEVTRLD